MPMAGGPADPLLMVERSQIPLHRGPPLPVPSHSHESLPVPFEAAPPLWAHSPAHPSVSAATVPRAARGSSPESYLSRGLAVEQQECDFLGASLGLGATNSPTHNAAETHAAEMHSAAARVVQEEQGVWGRAHESWGAGGGMGLGCNASDSATTPGLRTPEGSQVQLQPYEKCANTFDSR